MDAKKNSLSDIRVPQLQVQNLKWTTESEIEASVSELYTYSEATALSSINWYEYHKKSKAKMSRTLRALAIILTTLGGLTPIISALGWATLELQKGVLNLNVGQLGYLLLGLAAACVGFDKFFGFSSGWMRYISTKMALEKSLSEFRLDWAMMISKFNGNPPTVDQVQLMVQRIKEFLTFINSQVEQETLVWISEFKTNISELDKSAKAGSDSIQPGAIAVTVTNGMDTDDGFTVTLDGMDLKTVRGTKYQIGYVPPGAHKISVRAKIKNEELDASELATVAPGEIANVTLSLPVKEAQP